MSERACDPHGARTQLYQWIERYPRGRPCVFFPWMVFNLALASIKLAWMAVYNAVLWLIVAVLVVKEKPDGTS